MALIHINDDIVFSFDVDQREHPSRRASVSSDVKGGRGNEPAGAKTEKALRNDYRDTLTNVHNLAFSATNGMDGKLLLCCE